jgi:glutamyl-tRNA synthetase
VNFVHEIWDQASFFFVAPNNYDEANVKKFWKEDTSGILQEVIQIISDTEPYSSESIEPTIKNYINEKGHGMGKVMNALRISLVGESKGPGIADICELIGKDETIKRLQKAIATLG